MSATVGTRMAVAACAAALAGALMTAPAAAADPLDDAFLSALDRAGAAVRQSRGHRRTR